ncbi:MAG TPA: hypothetical protein VFB81_12245 [Myxococcales bacterium]|nr:hypothetical protein [Myxococcales bacterium]
MTSAVRDRLIYCAALVFGAAPLWVTWQLPIVDLPQHLHLISTLHRLGDTTTLYPDLFQRRPELTPYLGYYYAVSVLHWTVPLELANRLFLCGYVVGLPLSLAALLRSLGRPAWPSLLALPFAYGDSFAWGFINYCSALPLALLSCALFVRALRDPGRRALWAALHAPVLVLVLLFHVQVFTFLALALPWLLLVVEVEAPGGWRPRWPALASVVPAVLLFLIWVVLRAGAPTEIQQGAPWKAWGPMLSEQNLAYKPFDQNLNELWLVLANSLRDGSDRDALWVVVAAAAVAAALGVEGELRRPSRDALRSLGAMLGLAAAALVLFFTLPFDIRGYIYYLNTRYAHLAAVALVGCLPEARASLRPHLRWAAAAAVAWFGFTLARGYARFDAESRPIRELAALESPRPRVVGLIYDTSSRVAAHPVFLHSACELARTGGGICNFSFALTPHSPLQYRGTPPPTFPSEWRPDQFRWEAMSGAYDHYLVRGVPPERALGGHVGRELEVAGGSGGFWLLQRR